MTGRSEATDQRAGRRFLRPLRLWLLLGLLTMAALLPLLILAGYAILARVQDERAVDNVEG